MAENSEYLAMIDNYHLSRKNASYRLVIWHGHLWGGRLQMAVIGERQVTEGNERNSSGREVSLCHHIEMSSW